jgi:HEAT repeat protein
MSTAAISRARVPVRCGILALAALTAAWQVAAAQQKTPREELRYDGRDFDHWRHVLQTELKAEPRVEAITALGAFGARGYAAEAVAELLDAAVDLVEPEPVYVGGEHAIDAARKEYNTLQAGIRLALQRIGEPAVPGLQGELDHRSAVRRRVAADALGWLRTKALSAVPALLKAARDPDAQVRATAIQAIVSIDSKAPGALEALEQAFKDRDSSVSIVALGALVTLDPQSDVAGKTINAALNHGDPRLRRQALELLRYVPAPAQLDKAALLAALKDPDHRVRQQAYPVIGLLGDEAKQAVPQLIEALRYAEANDRIALVEALGQIGPDARDALPLMEDMLQKEMAAAGLPAGAYSSASSASFGGRGSRSLPSALSAARRNILGSSANSRTSPGSRPPSGFGSGSSRPTP